MSKPTLIYFATRGRAELIRLVLAEAGVAFDEHPVGVGTPPHAGRPTDFDALKASGLLPFGAVPVWEEPSGLRLAQSMAIVRYLGHKHGLMGQSAEETARIDQLLGGYEDVRGELRRLFIVPEGERAALRAQLASEFLPRWAGYFEKLLAQNAGGDGFFVGERLSVADLAVWYLVEMMRDNGFGEALAKAPKLGAFFTRLAERPCLGGYVRSPGRFALVPMPR